MNILASAQSSLSQLNAADILFFLGALVLAVLAIKVVAKVMKFLLIAGAIVLGIVFLFSSGIIH